MTSGNIGFFTDPHIGVRRISNTTPASSNKFRNHVFETALDAAALCRKQAGTVVCLGDLFDTHSNPEWVIKQGLRVAKACDIVLGGNHDITARRDDISSLDLVAEVLADEEDVTVVRAPYGEPHVHVQTLQPSVTGKSADLFLIPHVTTQELFEDSLQEAEEMSRNSSADRKLLLLHVNFDLSFDVNETSLVLNRDWANRLIDQDVFDFILTGHEHPPSNHLGNRMVVLGNTVPLSQGEVGPRRVAVYSIEDNTIEYHPLPSLYKVVIDNAAERIDELGDFVVVNEPSDENTIGYVEVKGEVSSEQFSSVQKAIRRLWKRYPNLVSLKNSTWLRGMGVDPDHVDEPLESLEDKIRRDLQDRPDFLAVFEEIMQEVGDQE